MINNSQEPKKNNVYNDMINYLSAHHIQEVDKCAERLRKFLPAEKSLTECKLLLAYGGGKDSSYMTAFVRLVQLTLYKKYGKRQDRHIFYLFSYPLLSVKLS